MHLKKYFRIALCLVSLSCLAIPSIALAGLEDGTAAFDRKDYATALREWRPLATSGDARAQGLIGVMYDQGLGVPQDYKEAVKWYRLAAEQGNATAQSLIGEMYNQGLGVSQDYKEAVKWYRLAAEQGNAMALYNLGVKYHHGQGVPQDLKEAVKRYRSAADRGQVNAQHNLGVMYDIGQGAPQDYKEAVKWYRLAADQGHSGAQSNLGRKYLSGQGVPSNRVAAYALYNLSAASDSSDGTASRNRASLTEALLPREIEAAQDLTRELAKPGNLLKALDKYITNPAIKERTAAVAMPDAAAPPPAPSGDSFPERPAKRPGVVSCNTRCVNADCWRTYDDGRKVRFQAKRKFDQFSGDWKFDSGSC